jgi:integrase
VSILIQRKKKRRRSWEALPLQPELAVELRDYIRGNSVKPGERVFPIGDRQVRNIFYQAGLSAIGRRVHPHEFRHLYIKSLIDEGIPVAVASKMVGHASVETTMGHYYELTEAQRAEVQRRVPV